MAVARTLFSLTLEDKYTRYSTEGYTLHLYEYPVTLNQDYTVTGTRATDADGDYIVGVDDGDGVYTFSDVEYGEYVVIAYRTGNRPQIVSGYARFVVMPKFAADEIACSQTDATILKDKLNVIIQYILDNDTGWTGTPPTVIS